MTWEFTDLDGRDCAPAPGRLAQITAPKTTHPSRSKRSLFFDTNEWLPGVLPRGLDYSPCDSQNRDECGWLKIRIALRWCFLQNGCRALCERVRGNRMVKASSQARAKFQFEEE